MNKAKQMLHVIKPKPCPKELIRIGGSKDGAYLVPDDLAGITDCYSPGTNNFKWFEDELSKKYNTKCHMYDMSSDVDQWIADIPKEVARYRRRGRQYLFGRMGEQDISRLKWRFNIANEHRRCRVKKSSSYV